MNSYGFAAKSVYPSELGLHIEHYTEAEAQAAYADAKSKGMDVRLDGLVLTWRFHNPRSPHPVVLATRQGRKVLRVSRDKSRLLQHRRLRDAALGRKLSRVRKAARLPHG